MKNIYVDYGFFNFIYRSSDGLITGLKILTKNDFAVCTMKGKINDSGLVQSILSSEGIELSESTPDTPVIDYRILPKKTGRKSRKNIIVSSKGRINTLIGAVDQIISKENKIVHSRVTKETSININLNLRGSGKSKIKTGIGFFDHMLHQIARHSNIDLCVNAKGDLHIDEHHTVEDTGIAFGEALSKALGDRRGIMRFGFFAPMDDSLGACFIDLGGRSYLKFIADFKREKIGDFPTELVMEFFKGLSTGLRANIHLKISGENDHHKIEALFKAFAKALNEALKKDGRNFDTLPSTKGII